MQPYDLAMIGVLLGATLWGFFKGMARQVASLVSLVASYFVALRFSPLVAPYLGQPQPLDRFLAMLLLYLLTSLTIWLVFRQVSQVIERVQLKDFDRQVGALFGAAKGVLLCVAITFFAVSLSAERRKTVLASRSGPYIARLLQQADPLMPKEMPALLDSYRRELEEQLNPRGSGSSQLGIGHSPPAHHRPMDRTRERYRR
ncbi:MAG TPA: CvpA family protein [Pirellulales bacterium]|jgi:membrane protein required for colicin V production|nr:CvpA family protein [Pirellulales bacterium]